MDFGDFDLFRNGIYEKGYQDGVIEAKTRNYEDNIASGVTYGNQWAGEYASFNAFIDELKHKQTQSSNPLLQSAKIWKLVEEIEEILRNSSPPQNDVRSVDSARKEARKKYNILLAMLGLRTGTKENVQNSQF